MARHSIHTGRTLPSWFDDAKLGVFLHWGLYSVPGWAPQVPDIQTQLREHGPAHLFTHSPYAEWYANTMRIAGSETAEHHRAVYGDAPYSAFVEPFQAASREADLDALAGVCAAAGARYVVLTTKHHEGFCLWPTAVQHPVHGDGWHAARDLVGDLTEAVRGRGMRMGLYYSGGLDWSLHDIVIRDLATALLAIPQDEAYTRTCDTHLRELIDRYAPSVLWNDIAAPTMLDLDELFGHFYATVPDGVVNDRWGQGGSSRGPGADRVLAATLRGVSWGIERAWPLIPKRYKSLEFTVRPPHYDFTTPEYAQHDAIVTRKWEATRGVGHSFGANRNERPADVLTARELVRSFVDIVAKGGNLLIGIGPEPDGTIPDWQQAPLHGLGDWLGTNGGAIYGSRPWVRAEGRTSSGTPVRFTCTDGALHVVLLEQPTQRSFSLWGVDGRNVEGVSIPGLTDADVSWRLDEEGCIEVTVPERLPPSPALAVTLTHRTGDPAALDPT